MAASTLPASAEAAEPPPATGPAATLAPGTATPANDIVVTRAKAVDRFAHAAAWPALKADLAASACARSPAGSTTMAPRNAPWSQNGRRVHAL